jgi:glc operon protein GlcG
MHDSSTAIDADNAVILTQICVFVKTSVMAPDDTSKVGISQAEARSCIDAATAQSAALGIRVSVAVVDEGGYLIELSRMDGAPALSPQIAEAKAAGAAVMGRPGDVLADNYEKRPGFFAAASSLARRPLVPGLGSVLLMRNGRLNGAIGVSGGRPEQDLEVAHAGLAALSTG